jgi:two-component system NtrC family sensor kinase
MPELRKTRAGLAVKLAVCLTISAAAFATLFGYLNFYNQRRSLEQVIVLSADRVSDLIQRSTRYSMLRNDREALYHLIREFGEEPGVRRVRIFNEEGRISFSTDPLEVNAMVDKRAEACYACHSQQEPLHRLERPDRARIFNPTGHERVLAVIRPIENQPDCSSAACHAHPPERRILGVIDSHLSLAAVDEELAEHRDHLVLVTLAAVVIMCLVSLLFVWMVVHKPVRELIVGTQKVAGGNLNYRIPVRSTDELGILAKSFNKMTADLSGAHAELTEWARTLEDRVRRKTEELELAHASLVNSEKMASLGKLAAVVAHEVNNPLFGMLTYARLTLKSLEKSGLDPAVKVEMAGHLQVIERESKRCGEIMRNLLLFARQGSSELAAPRMESGDLNALVERALKLVRHQFELQSVELRAELAKDLPPVECDPGQIQQALLVLMVNAAEAMPSGGSLWLRTELSDGGQSCLIRVRDSGAGISPEHLSQIFEPFFTTKEDQHRTGLGLPIARSIVERHGGSIEVQSAVGRGTEFVVKLPLSPNGTNRGGTK